MLEINSFDTSFYEERFARLRDELVKKSGVVFFDSDMEIVLLELWALLLDMQDYTMDVTSEQMEKEMLRFLSGDLAKRKGAKGTLFAKNMPSKWIYKHTLLDKIANIPFEVVDNVYIQDNEIVAYNLIQHDNCSTKQNMVLEKGTEIEITLHSAMEVDQPFTLYFDIENKRVTPSPAYLQATITCYYESIHGRCQLTFKDETYGFLTSGAFVVFPHKEHCEIFAQQGWKLHIVVEDAWYDEAPRLRHIYLNPLKIKQQITYATSLVFPMQRILFVQDAFAFDGILYAFVYQNKGYQSISFIKKQCPGGVYIYIPMECVGEHMLLILQRKDTISVGSTNGQSTQQISLPYKDIETMQLMIKQAEKWHEGRVYDIGTYQKPQPYGAWYNAQEGWLQFGCGSDFLIPEKGSDNILYRELILSKGKKGNIKEHVLTSTNFEQPMPTQGGEDEETLQEAWKRVSTDFYQYSSLDASDIQRIAEQFPGNALTYVKCVPKKYLSTIYKEQGYALILNGSIELSSTYLSMMKQWLMNQLPQGIQVELMQAEKTIVSMRLQATFTPNEEHEIRQSIENWLKEKAIGSRIRCVDLIQFLLHNTQIKEISECCFYDHQQEVDQFVIPYHSFQVIGELEIIANV